MNPSLQRDGRPFGAAPVLFLIFFIVDDLFGQNRSEALRLCTMLRDYQRQAGVRFYISVQMRLDKARDEELLHAMRQAGINILAVGYESPIADELKAMDKRLDPETTIDLTRLYHGAGFRIHGMFIFGYPAPDGLRFQLSAEDRVRHFCRFIRKARLDTLQVMLPIPLPGAELTNRLTRSRRVYSTHDVGLEYYDGNFPVFQPDAPMLPEEMQASVQKIMRRFYGPRRLLSVVMNILSFPGVVFRLHKLSDWWRRWSGRWWTSIYRAGGWMTLRRWTVAFRKDGFLRKLAEAKRNCVAGGGNGPGGH